MKNQVVPRSSPKPDARRPGAPGLRGRTGTTRTATGPTKPIGDLPEQFPHVPSDLEVLAGVHHENRWSHS